MLKGHVTGGGARDKLLSLVEEDDDDEDEEEVQDISPTKPSATVVKPASKPAQSPSSPTSPPAQNNTDKNLKASKTSPKTSPNTSATASPRTAASSPPSAKPSNLTSSDKKESFARKRSLTKQVCLDVPVSAGGCQSAADGRRESAGGLKVPATDTTQLSLELLEDKDNTAVRPFPNLPDDALSKLGLLRKKGEPVSGEHLASETDVEEKYSSLSLAFKTDKMTLDQRIDLHERSRDNAEQNIDKELQSLKDAMESLSPFCADSSTRDIYSRIQHHIDILEQSTSRVSSRAEMHGAVQQELRLSKAVDVMMQHVENLKHLYEKEHAELEDTRKMLQETKTLNCEGGEASLASKRYSLAGQANATKVSQLLKTSAIISSFKKAGRKTSGQCSGLGEKDKPSTSNQ